MHLELGRQAFDLHDQRAPVVRVNGNRGCPLAAYILRCARLARDPGAPAAERAHWLLLLAEAHGAIGS
jgi:hypothetical protein